MKLTEILQGDKDRYKENMKALRRHASPRGGKRHKTLALSLGREEKGRSDQWTFNDKNRGRGRRGGEWRIP